MTKVTFENLVTGDRIQASDGRALLVEWIELENGVVAVDMGGESPHRFTDCHGFVFKVS